MCLRAAEILPTSCAEIKTKNKFATNGKYTIRPIANGKEYSVYCDMQEYGGGWTLVTLIKSDKGDQWNPAALNTGDLATFTTSPSRVSKLPDAEINALLGKGGTRWVTASDQRTFYRMTSRPWNSNHGKANSCGYKQDFYDARAEPASKPAWKTATLHIACGGIHDGKTWGALSGIHVNPPTHLGAHHYTKGWKQNGYVYVRSASFVVAPDPPSCQSIKSQSSSAKNGVYTIQPIPGGKSYKVYCNMQEYGGGWTLVTLIKSDKGDQWNPAALNTGDLATFTTSPSRVSKLPDAEINALLGKGGTRWVTASDQRTFYRMTSRPWNSNHGKANSCGYKQDFYDARAEPASKPAWKTATLHIACGGIHDGKTWGALSGIHVNPPTHLGAHHYTKGWKQNGYVYVRSLAAFNCPSGWIKDGSTGCKGSCGLVFSNLHVVYFTACVSNAHDCIIRRERVPDKERRMRQQA